MSIFIISGLHFALRAGKEHRALRGGPTSQLTIHSDPDGKRYVQYTEDTSKARQGGINNVNSAPKTVRAYENNVNPHRCIVRLLEKYESLCPKPRPNFFYLKPLKSSAKYTTIWFASKPIGWNMLNSTVSKVCRNAKLDGFRTNHSLKATAATRLYSRGLDEQLIQEITGHKSLAVRKYKRTPSNLKRKVSDVLYGNGIEQQNVNGGASTSTKVGASTSTKVGASTSTEVGASTSTEVGASTSTEISTRPGAKKYACN